MKAAPHPWSSIPIPSDFLLCRGAEIQPKLGDQNSHMEDPGEDDVRFRNATEAIDYDSYSWEIFIEDVAAGIYLEEGSPSMGATCVSTAEGASDYADHTISYRPPTRPPTTRQQRRSVIADITRVRWLICSRNSCD